MEFVGEAVKEYVLATGGSGQKVVVLGIACWGIVNNKWALTGQEVGRLLASHNHVSPCCRQQ